MRRVDGSASREAGARDGAEHHHRDGRTAEHEAEPSEDAVGYFAALLVHTKAQRREEGADEHHHEGNDLVRAFLRVESCGEQHQGRRDERPEHETLAVRQLVQRREAVGEDGETDDTEEDKGQTGNDVHGKLLWK